MQQGAAGKKGQFANNRRKCTIEGQLDESFVAYCKQRFHIRGVPRPLWDDAISDITIGVLQGEQRDWVLYRWIYKWENSPKELTFTDAGFHTEEGDYTEEAEKALEHRASPQAQPWQILSAIETGFCRCGHEMEIELNTPIDSEGIGGDIGHCENCLCGFDRGPSGGYLKGNFYIDSVVRGGSGQPTTGSAAFENSQGKKVNSLTQ